ncbi:MAG TPA: hypothetical protein DER02_01430 [Gammaproteobacteria bacterium]|nr:hypothetical protein [Gammaproteobacteria bacterium]|tara:strand:+ start:2317 stop:2544 length:228 start_codon:yes stop_codon:yes gene_type:complete
MPSQQVVKPAKTTILALVLLQFAQPRRERITILSSANAMLRLGAQSIGRSVSVIGVCYRHLPQVMGIRQQTYLMN